MPTHNVSIDLRIDLPRERLQPNVFMLSSWQVLSLQQFEPILMDFEAYLQILLDVLAFFQFLLDYNPWIFFSSENELVLLLSQIELLVAPLLNHLALPLLF